MPAARAGKEAGSPMDMMPPGGGPEPLKVMRMALALVLAAFLGAALGLVWQALKGEEPAAQAEAAGPEAAP